VGRAGVEERVLVREVALSFQKESRMETTATSPKIVTPDGAAEGFIGSIASHLSSIR
jgi:hypothetical protein